jgi:hypothetical protein
MDTLWGREPVAILAAIRAIVVLVVAFGLKLTPDQIAAVYLVAETVLSLIARKTVYAPASVDA